MNMGENQNFLKEIPRDSIILRPSDNFDPSFIFEKYFEIISNTNYWHAFLIHNAVKHERNKILKIIVDYVYPESLLPIHFERRGVDYIFLARNCTGAIFKLLKRNLFIPDPYDSTWTYSCDIILKYATISQLLLPTNESIAKILQKLYDKTSKTLNLERFSDNTELRDYTPLSQPKLLRFVLYISREFKPISINLGDNEIKDLSPFHTLKDLTTLRSLDLRKNLIGDFNELRHLGCLNLIELWLDGNPLCENYGLFSYVENMRNIFPNLQNLDGFELAIPVKRSKRIKKRKAIIEDAMSKLTNLNRVWIKWFLRDADYEIIKFVPSFLNLLKKNKIPVEAFSEKNSNNLMKWLVPRMIEFGIEKFEFSLQKKALNYVIKHLDILENITLPPITKNERCLRKCGQTNLKKLCSINASFRKTLKRLKLCWRCGHPRLFKNKKKISNAQAIPLELQVCICPFAPLMKEGCISGIPVHERHPDSTKAPVAMDTLPTSTEVFMSKKSLQNYLDHQMSDLSSSYSQEDIQDCPIICVQSPITVSSGALSPSPVSLQEDETVIYNEKDINQKLKLEDSPYSPKEV